MGNSFSFANMQQTKKITELISKGIVRPIVNAHMFLLTHLQLYNCGKITTSNFFKNSVVADGLGNFPSAKTFEITFGT